MSWQQSGPRRISYLLSHFGDLDPSNTAEQLSGVVDALSTYCTAIRLA